MLYLAQVINFQVVVVFTVIFLAELALVWLPWSNGMIGACRYSPFLLIKEKVSMKPQKKTAGYKIPQTGFNLQKALGPSPILGGGPLILKRGRTK